MVMLTIPDIERVVKGIIDNYLVVIDEDKIRIEE